MTTNIHAPVSYKLTPRFVCGVVKMQPLYDDFTLYRTSNEQSGIPTRTFWLLAATTIKSNYLRLVLFLRKVEEGREPTFDDL